MQSEFPLSRSRYNDSSTMARMARLSLRFHAPKSQFTRKKQVRSRDKNHKLTNY